MYIVCSACLSYYVCFLGYLVMLLTLYLHQEVNCLQVFPFGREREENGYKTESSHVVCDLNSIIQNRK